MTLDLTTANLLTTPGATGGASAQPGTAPGAGTAAAGNAQTVTSPFALMVNANQAQSGATAVRPNTTPAAMPASPLASATTTATATATAPVPSTPPATATTPPAVLATTMPTAPVREAALSSASPLPISGATGSPVTTAASETDGAGFALEDVPPVTPVAAIAPAGTKRNVQVQDAIDPASPGDASTLALATSDGRPAQATAVEGAQTQLAPSSPAATPAPADTSLPGAKATETAKPVSEGIPADKSVSTPKPVSEVIPADKSVSTPMPVSEPLQGPPVPVTTGASTVAANGQATLPASAGSATDMATNVTANAALQPAAVAKPLAQQGKADTAADTGPGKSTAATGKTAAATSPSATNPTPATQPSAASPAMDAGRVLGDGADASALRQQPSPHSAIQTASSLAARPAANPAGSAAPSASATPTAGTATTSAAPSAATAATSDPAAALAAGKAAAPTAAQAGAPITALPGAMGDLQAQHQAASQEAADADLAAQAENDLSLARVDGRLAADRSGATPQRFTPHTTAQLAGQITKHVSNGNRVFDIRLDPAELGKVDVRIELRADNRVHAVLTVERAETLNELQRSARDLERSLAEAGLELGENGLSFQMSDGQNPAEDDRRSQGEALPIFTQTTEMTQRAEDELASRPRSAYGFLLSGRSGVDLQV
jgi:flagellar hook-length control protein FliK